ncbi:MAG TPA: acyl-CoA dehydrogenase family protein [Stellaceae bacterium]|jgi:acyl-CoA dehydrogenase
MSAIRQQASPTENGVDWLKMVDELGPRFAARAADHDANDSFVADNYAELKERGVLAAFIPAELGGGGASYAEICEMLRRLGRHCSSTALALSMHTHLAAALVWRWRRDPQAVEAFLKRVAGEQLVLISTAASDWLNGSGRAERVDGGWRVTGRKIFGSGVPAGDFLITGAVYDDPEAGATVLHFPLSLQADGVRVLDTWHVMGMRATGSHDVAIEGAFVPESAVSLRRPQGKWHLALHLGVMMALPIIYGVYLGIAEAARDLALRRARERARNSADLCYLVGEMENTLSAARLAHADMVTIAASAEPGPETTNRIAINRTLVGRAVLGAVEKAIEVAGGTALYRDVGLERLFRDVQAARYHPLQEKVQHCYTGRLALGLDIDG